MQISVTRPHSSSDTISSRICVTMKWHSLQQGPRVSLDQYRALTSPRTWVNTQDAIQTTRATLVVARPKSGLPTIIARWALQVRSTWIILYREWEIRAASAKTPFITKRISLAGLSSPATKRLTRKRSYPWPRSSQSWNWWLTVSSGTITTHCPLMKKISM